MIYDEWKEVVADWCGNEGFRGRNSSGAQIQIGDVDGVAGIRPMELLLLGLAGCTGVDVVTILTKKHYKLSKFQIQVRGKRAVEHPRVFTRIDVKYILWGDHLKTLDVEKAIQLSEDKYCSASNMLGEVASIHTSYQINPDSED